MTVPHIYEPTMINYGFSQLNFVLCLHAISGVVLQIGRHISSEGGVGLSGEWSNKSQGLHLSRVLIDLD